MKDPAIAAPSRSALNSAPPYPYQRCYCSQCGSALWVFSPEWPELPHPFASVIDTPLPVQPEHTHLMLGSKAPWVDVTLRKGDLQLDEYPEESIAEWHERHGVLR
ncbi:putative glutathione-dependent formaldehyde activating protein [Pseudomonas sp. FH1]|nr:putative glutathione-dependent formaldehyde activating protein [Pseudomonas sp. FH1]